ncbi:MAG: hypothetical protein ACYDHH_24225 [Solirubrobacteraceae bacterium]
MHGTSIAPPPVFESGASPSLMLIVWGLLALAAFCYAVLLAVRNRDVLPVAACIGALICALNEPIYDILGKLVYAHAPSGYIAYTAFGRHIPWSLVIGYLPWVGLVPYLLSRLMARGISRSRLHLIALGLTASVGVVEILNALWLHGWRYYAPESGRGVLAGGIVQMSAMPIVCGFLFYAFADRFTGTRRALLGLVIPTMALPLVFAATSWPLYVSNYADVSQAVRWAAAGLTVVFCVLAVLAAAYLAERWHGLQTNPDGSVADRPAPLERPAAAPARVTVQSPA